MAAEIIDFRSGRTVAEQDVDLLRRRVVNTAYHQSLLWLSDVYGRQGRLERLEETVSAMKRAKEVVS